MFTSIPQNASVLNHLLIRKGYSKDRPFILPFPVSVTETIECPGRYEYPSTVIVRSIYPEGDTVVLVGEQDAEKTYQGKELISSKWTGVTKAVIDENPAPDDPFEREYVYWSIQPLMRPAVVNFAIEGDYYSIETHSKDEKVIHVNGYLWKDEHWAHTEVCWFIVPLKKFIKNYKKRGVEYTDEIYEQVKQSQTDFTDEAEAQECCQHYFNGGPADRLLGFSELTEDTPDGNYVNIN